MDLKPEDMQRIADHREAACKAVKPCSKCGSDQVQLVSWIGAFCKTKCRHCQHKETFTHPHHLPQ